MREKLDLLKQESADGSGGKDFLAAMSPLERTLFVIDETKVNPELVEAALLHIVTDADMQASWRGDGGKCGAVLVFLPGMGEIQKVHDYLSSSQALMDGLKGGSCVLHRLHSSVPSAEQQRAFQAVSVGTLKVILATNIAETSITFDDVVFVIDYGRQKVRVGCVSLFCVCSISLRSSVCLSFCAGA